MPTAARKKPGRAAGPTSVYTPRQKRLRARLRKDGLDGLLISNPHDIRYLTGFPGEDSLALVTARKLFILTDSRFREEMKTVKGVAEGVERAGEMIEALKTLVGDLKPKALGFQADHVSVAAHHAWARALGPRRLKPTNGVLLEQRMIKDEAEIALIKRGVAIQQEALKAVLPTIRPGQAESVIAARLELEMKARGADGASFDTICAARANGARPHARPGITKTAAGQPLLIDWGASVSGYRSDMTRTFSLGRWPKQLAEAYPVVLDAFNAASDAVAPGRTGKELDAIARGVIERAGFGPQFAHSLGHGIGLDIHEPPKLSKFGTVRLRPGMIVTIEPGIYLPGIGGVRLEDDVLVTERGGKNLCSLPKDMKWATL